MDGMHSETRWAYTTDSDNYSASFQFELPPTSTIAEISLGGYYEFDDKAHVDIGFTGCSFLDNNGVTRTDSFPDIDRFDSTRVFSRNGLTSASYQIRVSNCAAYSLVNFFYWPAVN
ncbi:hypothetical protein [Nostoc sp. NOS(2021)]|uniref:hypothetical protein n=1 Tax=Nostoc sp. NOS(2021) TaxID=2815407 RepID=UPI0025F6AE17|nr:hypothetical protein [Nostoc sp. NOS(2021)]